MDALIALPLLIGLVALGRAVYLKGWKEVFKANYQLQIPTLAKHGLIAFFVVQFGAGFLFQFKIIGESMARQLLSPTWGSLVVSAIAGWVLALNWNQR